MFVSDAIRSKLASLLQPWLQEEPDIDLELGFLRSRIRGRNLVLDASALDRLLDGSSRLSFKSVRIGEFLVRISPWEAPAFSFEVRGVDVILAPRESEECSRGMQDMTDLRATEMKQMLGLLDPEGDSLHETLEKLSAISSSRNRFMNATTNVGLKHCRLQVYDIHLKLQLPFMDESLAFFLRVKELHLESVLVSSLLKELVGALFMPQEESSFVLNGSGLEIGLKRKDHFNCIASSGDLSNCIRLKNLQLSGFDTHAPHVNLAFSPFDLPVLLVVFDMLFSKVKGTRNGRELWKIATRGIRCLTPNYKPSFCILVSTVVLWLRHVRAYETLLLLVGYSDEKLFNQTVTRMAQDKKFLSCVKHQWKVVSDIEEELPVEAVARARQLARYRAALHFRHNGLELATDVHMTFWWKFLAPLSFLWKVFCSIFYSIGHILFFLRIVLVRDFEGRLSLLSDTNDSYSKQRFSLSLGEISITLSPISSVRPPIKEKSESDIQLSELNLLSFCITMNNLCFVYTEDFIAQCLSLTCGNFKIHSFPFSRVPLLRSNSGIELHHSYRGHHLKVDNEFKAILWSEPAPQFQISKNDSVKFTSDSWILILENYLGEMWSDWETNSKRFEQNNIQQLELPFLLCEIKSSVVDPYLHAPDHGLWKCSLAVGKLNFNLGYLSIMSISLLLREIQDIYHLTATSGGPEVLSHSSSIIEEQTQLKWENRCESYASQMKMTMLRMVPKKNLQIGVAIIGPNIRISMAGEGLTGTHLTAQGLDDCCFTIDLGNIEFAAWPTSKAVLTALTGKSRLDESEVRCLQLIDTQSVENQKTYSNGTCSSQGCLAISACLRCNGINAFLEDIKENQRSQIFGPMSIKIQSSSHRDYWRSLTASPNASSMNLSGMATGATLLFYVDELYTFFQVLQGLSVLSDAYINLNSTNGFYFRELIQKNMASTNSDFNRNTLVSEEKCAAFIFKSTKFIFEATLDFGSLDVILSNSRKVHVMGDHEKASTSAKCQENMTTKYKKTMVGMLVVPEFGVGVSVQRLCFQISSEEGFVKVLCDAIGIQSVIFNCQDQMGKCTDGSELRNLLHESSNFLYEFSLSDCTFSISAGRHEDSSSSRNASNAVDGSNFSSLMPSYTMEGPDLIISSESSEIQSCSPSQELGQGRLLCTSVLEPVSNCWFLLINIGLGAILLVECSIKNVLVGADQANKLMSSLSIDGEFHSISCEIQGGLVLLETTALATFVHCFREYLLCFMNLFSSISSRKQSETVATVMVLDEGMASPIDQLQDAGSSIIPLVAQTASLESKWKFLEILTIRMSEFSLVLAVADGSGGAWELMLEADFHLKFELMDARRKFLFDLSRLAVRSQHAQKSYLQEAPRGVPIPHFRPYSANDLSSNTGARHPTPSLITESKLPVLDDSPLIPKRGFLEGDVSGSFVMKNENDILKHMVASIMVEKAIQNCEVGPQWLKNDWVGRGSVSGFDLTITISEIVMLLALIAPFSGFSSGKTSRDPERRLGYGNQHENDSSEYTIPDGAVVAIEDLHQHMYFVVEPVENMYRLGGAIHYSLVGERALFRVKYHRQWGWKSSISWFSLISLHAKNDAGKPLRLNFRPGSGFVEISSTNDRGWALWQMFPYRPESYEGDNDLESYYQLTRKAFYLVNQKSDCAVAFVDGLPEFVKKPGNPFKMKVFHNISPTQGIVRKDVQNAYSDETCETNERENSTIVNKRMSSAQVSYLPYVNITIDKVTLTILNEVPDANEKFPLLRGTVDNLQFIVQIVSPKVRLISTMTAGIFYLDASRNLWREIVFPFEVCIFYRSRYMFQSEEIAQQGVPVCFYCRMGRVNISLTELSLDILLFLVGEMNLAGPYAVKSSMIFANCCKVENRSGLSLLCHFNDNQQARIAGKQSAAIFLRWGVLADRLPENSSLVSLQLVAPGTFSTSPIHLSLSNTRVLAWRTRVVSLQDSRTFPGPFVVVDISRKSEDGLSLVVTPLLRIHNASGFSMELRFRRPQEAEAKYASVLLRNGDAIDDCMAVFDALNLSGGVKKALMSLSLGNFLLSFRPEIPEYLEKSEKPVSIDWSEELQGGKAIRLSGIFDKLNYRFKKAFGVESVKSSFSTVHCSLSVEGSHVTSLHFLIEAITREVPVIRPHNVGDTSETSTSPVALQEQREIFLSPTVQVSNLLQSEIIVLLTESHPDLCTINSYDLMGKQATIPSGSNAFLYANPAIIYFTVTLAAFNSKCKPVNSGDWVKKLQKQKADVHYLDIELDFGGGRCFASLRLSRGERGTLEAIVFTSYTLQNDTHLSLFCYASNQKPLSREEIHKYGSSLPPELGSILPPMSSRSWLLKSNKVYLKWLEDKTSEALLDLDALSGFTQLCLEVQEEAGVKHIENLGVSLKPCLSNAAVPSQIVSMVPRYVISNESEVGIIICQCYAEGDSDGTFAIDSRQKAALPIRTVAHKRKEISLFDSMLKRHKNANVDSLIFICFSLKEIGWSRSGPICIASLGRFFLKFKRPSISLGYKSNSITEPENKLVRYAAVHIVEEGSTLVLHFHMPPEFTVPYRIENCLCDASITYYQKELTEPEILGPGNSVEYVWDDLNLPHKLVVQITGMHVSRDINLDKVCAWKPFVKTRQTRGLPLHVSWDKKAGDRRTKFDESHELEMLKVGYEVYADGSTRVLRICEFDDNCKEDKITQPCLKIQFRISYFAIHLLENGKQEVDWKEPPIYSTIIVARLGNIALDSIFALQHKFSEIKVQTLNVDEKWEGAPFAAMLRRNRLDYNDMNKNVLCIVFILDSTKSNVKQVKYSSIVLQPIDLNIDEETLMRLVPFWRTSLSDSSKPSQQFYFRHFEIHPIKIVGSFLPGSPNSSYSSAQETLRSLLHSVIKIPAVKTMVVELNGVLLTHALVTARELFIKCAQHYSWYAMRAVYIAKGSPLLPPAFASIFDDTASSSLDVFFDPSSGSINLPGLTLGMFKFISKCINTKGFSGTKRYFGDLGKTMKMAGSNVLFTAITEISDNVLKGAETSGFNGMVNGFHQGILKLAMEPSLLGTAIMEGGPDRKIKLDRSPGVDELYIEGYLQAMLDVIYKQEYLRVRVIDDQVILKNLPPNSSLINDVMEHVKSFLVSKALLKGEPSMSSTPLRHLRGESEWKIGPTVLTLCEHLFVSFSIRMLRKQANKFIASTKWKGKSRVEDPGSEIVLPSSQEKQVKSNRNWGVGKFFLSGILAYVDGRLCRCIPNAIARRIVSGFLLSFLDKDSTE